MVADQLMWSTIRWDGSIAPDWIATPSRYPRRRLFDSPSYVVTLFWGRFQGTCYQKRKQDLAPLRQSISIFSNAPITDWTQSLPQMKDDCGRGPPQCLGVGVGEGWYIYRILLVLSVRVRLHWLVAIYFARLVTFRFVLFDVLRHFRRAAARHNDVEHLMTLFCKTKKEKKSGRESKCCA